MAVKDADGSDVGPHDPGQDRGVDVFDGAGQPHPASERGVGSHPTDAATQMGGQADD